MIAQLFLFLFLIIRIFNAMKKNNPIGMFDSGVGGTSIWKEIHELMPHENTIYLADSRNAPYGNRSSEEITALSIKNVRTLLDMNCKIIVVACNTATTNAIKTLRETFDVPLIGIEPAIKPAALQTKSGKIGILATKGTLSSTLFSNTSKAFATGTKIIEIIGEGLVRLIESGDLESETLRALLKKYVRPMIEADVDYIVLGCTHYPYLIPMLKELIPPSITIIDSGKAVAKHTKMVLEQENLLNLQKDPAVHRFYSNSDLKTLKFLLNPLPENSTIEILEF